MIYDPPSALDFAQALQDRLALIRTVAVYVLTGVPERPPTGYVWAQVGGTDEFRDRMSGLASDAAGSVILHSCGYTPEQALLTDQLVSDQLRDWQWSAESHISPLRLTQVSEVIRDTSIPTDVRYSITRIYRYDA